MISFVVSLYFFSHRRHLEKPGGFKVQRLQFLTDASAIKRSAASTSILKNGKRARVADIATPLLAIATSGCRNFSVRFGNSLCLFFREKKASRVIDEIDVMVPGIER